MSIPKTQLVQLSEQLIQELQDAGVLTDRDAAKPIVAARLTQDLGSVELPREDVTSRVITMLLSDIRGFSDIVAAHPAREVVKMMNRYFAVMDDVISRYEGTIDKIMGDSILVEFGLAKTGSDDVERAISCAIAMQIAMGTVNEKNQADNMPSLYMGIGINTGRVVAGYLGSKQHNDYTVIGREVNLTSRIEAHCLRGQILISDSTYELAKDFIEVGEANSIEVKGDRASFNIFELFATSSPKELVVPRREVRNSPRVRVSMSVSFQCLSDDTVLPEKHHGHAVDISYNGLQVETDVRLGEMSEVKLSLSTWLFDGNSSEIYARVIQSHDLGNGYRCALEFTSIDSNSQLAVKKLVDQLIASN